LQEEINPGNGGSISGGDRRVPGPEKGTCWGKFGNRKFLNLPSVRGKIRKWAKYSQERSEVTGVVARRVFQKGRGLEKMDAKWGGVGLHHVRWRGREGDKSHSNTTRGRNKDGVQ